MREGGIIAILIHDTGKSWEGHWLIAWTNSLQKGDSEIKS